MLAILPAACSGSAQAPAVSTPVAVATPTATAMAQCGDVASAYGGCGGGSTVELYAIDGAGHTWPGGPPLPASLKARLGAESSAVDANVVMWAFFQQHHLP
jgi:polyhydroxybutyrate depolymerase